MATRATWIPSEDPVRAFVDEVVRAGLMLADLLGGLIEDLPEDSFPGEEPVEVLLEMLTGSVRPALAGVGTPALEQATALLDAMAERALADLRTAAKLARAR